MNILIIGSGAREHAIGWKVKQSPLCANLFFAPGNAGTSFVGTNLDIGVNDFALLKEASINNNISLVVVGPEEPLVKGITDFFEKEAELKDITIIGPSQKGAFLEGSKDFAKQFMFRHKIPTARYLSVNKDNLKEGEQFLKTMNAPYVLKADGLAAGKGVLIIDDYNEACLSLSEMLEGKFGDAGNTVVIEEFLSGVELSAFVLTDGTHYFVLPEAKDYKRIGEGDSGLNTGGMGAVSPVPFADPEFMKKVEDRIIRPTIDGLAIENIVFKGFLFFGLINVEGDPYLIEYNVRLGDPETEAILPRLKNDLVELLLAAGNHTLNNIEASIEDQTAVTIVLVSGGYPESYEKGIPISGTDIPDSSLVFHAGTKYDKQEIVTNGGRVFAVTSIGRNIEEARNISLHNAAKIKFSGKYYRKDIGFDLNN